ncbi:MAG: 16S rRNA (cytosine(967)-C(5))-methyltransferase RsmB [Gammaproteobacteria bacterium]|nr:16S rRNA (cytosine(967)-C(5))-methyltransferase RsmB [Gammaproteobacteria bacterium]
MQTPLDGLTVRGHLSQSDRARAARHLARIIGRGDSLDHVVRRETNPLCLEMTYGCLRHYFSLAEAVEGRLARPLRAKDLDVLCLLLVGAYQLQRMRVPGHAAINETVSAVRALGKPWAAALVNAVLRKLPTRPADDASEHPPWLQGKIEALYGDQAPALLRANNQRAPMGLRVNCRKIEPAAYRALLNDAGIAFDDAWLPESILLRKPQPSATLPGFRDGLVAVQDVGAQLVGGFIRERLQGGRRVLDACAAPGGKLFHLLESGLQLDLTALDNAPARLQTLTEMAKRLGHEGFATIAADACGLDWWDGEPFDCVLVDAPCSGSGTLRRHPDIKVNRTPKQVRQASQLQGALLRNLWRTVRPGCTLMYCTCSILAEENDQVVESFLEAQADARAVGVELPTGTATRHGWQMLPTEPATDGFYLARIDRQP